MDIMPGLFQLRAQAPVPTVLSPPLDYAQTKQIWDLSAPSRLSLTTPASPIPLTLQRHTPPAPPLPTLDDCKELLLWPVGVHPLGGQVYAWLEHQVKEGGETAKCRLVTYHMRRPKVRLVVYPYGKDGKKLSGCNGRAILREETDWTLVNFDPYLVDNFKLKEEAWEWPRGASWALSRSRNVKSRWGTVVRMLLYLRWHVDWAAQGPLEPVETRKKLSTAGHTEGFSEEPIIGLG